jgi:hypothetical protein
MKAIPVLFADDTSILCTHHNLVDFRVNSETVLGNVTVSKQQKVMTV